MCLCGEGKLRRTTDSNSGALHGIRKRLKTVHFGITEANRSSRYVLCEPLAIARTRNGYYVHTQPFSLSVQPSQSRLRGTNAQRPSTVL